MGLFFLPLIFIQYETARWIWFIFENLFFIFSLKLISIAIDTLVSWKIILLTALAFQSFNPLALDLYNGQIHCFLLFLISLTWVFLKKDHETISGFFWGISLLIKQIAWPIFFLFLIYKKIKALYAGIITITIGYILTSILIGFHSIFNYYFNTLPSLTKHYMDCPWNISLWPIGTRVINGALFLTSESVNFFMQPLLSGNPFYYVIPFLLPVGILIVIIILIQKIQNLDSSFALLSGLSITINPIAWAYYNLFSMIPLAIVIKQLVALRFPSFVTSMSLFSFFAIAIDQLFWMQMTNYIQTGGWITNERFAHFNFNYLTHLFFFMPTLGAFILSFLAARPVEIPQRSVEKPPREE